jgi:hypothetical protein
MPNINDIFPSKWLKASDLPPQGITVTIATLAMEDVDESKPPMPVLHFHGHDKGLVLNKTNGQMLSHIFSDPNTDAWMGKPIMLVSEPVQFQGRIVDAVRVKPATQAPSQAPQAVVGAGGQPNAYTPPAPRQAPPAAPEEPNDDIPW